MNAAASAESAPRRGVLAQLLQEALTAGARLRSDARPPVADAAAFRANVWLMLRTASEQSEAAGYPVGDVRRAVFAATVLVDEFALNSRQPALASWAQKPLQEEFFGQHTGGETFFQNLQEQLARPDTPETADLLEVYQLCLLLGFRGRHAHGDGSELRVLQQATHEKIRRIRGAVPPLAPQWAPPSGETPPASHDPWLKPLVIGAGACVALAVVCFVVFAYLTSSGADAAVASLAGARA